jgi:hypothetical protein
LSFLKDTPAWTQYIQHGLFKPACQAETQSPDLPVLFSSHRCLKGRQVCGKKYFLDSPFAISLIIFFAFRKYLRPENLSPLIACSSQHLPHRATLKNSGSFQCLLLKRNSKIKLLKYIHHGH